jgi:hypothetical protein
MPEAISPAGANQEEPTMADKDTATDESKDSIDVEGHVKIFETPDEDTEARMRAGLQTNEKSEKDDVEGHFLKK